MNAVLERIGKIGIVPVVKLEEAEDACALAEALCRGGLPCAEITFRTKAAPMAIRRMREHFPHMCLGAGTVLHPGQVDEAVEAGAEFIVSPGFRPEVVKYCLDKKILVVPGISIPSEIEQAIALGLEVVKFFPAEQSGGLAKIKAMAAPYGNMRFIPTGGIHEGNLRTYLDFPGILACGGSWMVSGELTAGHEWDKIEKLTRNAVNTMLGFAVHGVGLLEQPAEKEEAIRRMEKLFGLSAFYNQIVIETNYMERAVHYLETIHQAAFDKSSAAWDEQGRMKSICLAGKIGGFSVKLVKV